MVQAIKEEIDTNNLDVELWVNIDAFEGYISEICESPIAVHDESRLSRTTKQRYKKQYLISISS